MLSRLFVVACLGMFALGPLVMLGGCVRHTREVIVEHDDDWYRGHGWHRDAEWHGDGHDRDRGWRHYD